MEFSKLSLILGVLLISANAQDPSPTPSPDFDCPDHSDSIHPDPRDCSKYFVCTNGLAWHESCPPGLLFDYNLLYCTWPHEAQCFGQTPPPTTRPPTQTPPPPTTTTQPPTTPQSNTTEIPVTGTTPPPLTDLTSSEPEPTTPADPVTTTPPPTDFRCPELEGTFPHPTNCNAYYICSGGVPSIAYCPDDLHYDPMLRVCNWPDVAGCNPGKVSIIRRH